MSAGATPRPDERGAAGPGRRGGLGITAASVGGALSGFVVLAIVARTVDLESSTVFVTFWSALMTAYGALAGLNTETARSVTHASLGRGGVSGAKVSRMLVLAPSLVAVVGLTAALTGLHTFGDAYGYLAVVVAASATAYAAEATLLGALAGSGRWGTYAGVVGLEALARIACVTVVALVAGSLGSVAIATGAATAAWVLMLVASGEARAACSVRLDEGLGQFGRRAGLAVIAAAVSSVLLVGFPVLVSFTTDPAAYAVAAPLMLAIAVTRAPIMVPLTAFQSVIVAQFVRNHARAGATVGRAVAVLLAVGALGAVAAYLLGPWLLALLFGESYRVSGPVLAGLTFASAGIAILTVTAALTQSLKLHGTLVAGWLVALVVSVGILVSPVDLEARVVLALLVGPYAGILVHGAAILRRVRRAVVGEGSSSDGRVAA